MAAGEEVKKDNHGSGGISDDGVDDLLDYCNDKDGTPDLGSV